jgi:hypothetical protein
VPFIELTQGKRTLVDPEDFAWLSAMRWYYSANNGGGYAQRHEKDEAGRWVNVKMHRLILRAPAGVEVDHIDGDKLNNTRANLRVCTRAQNARNLARKPGKRFKGTTLEKAKWRQKRWKAVVMVEGRNISLGYYMTEEEAARAYDAAAIKHFGEFARLNFPVLQQTA